MEPAELEITQTLIRTGTLSNSPLVRVLAQTFTRTSALAAGRLKVFWRSRIWTLIWTSLARRAGSKSKTLSVRETAALGDRRFVSVIQFERHRFLIGSSPSSITLLSKLPDESASGETIGIGSGEKI